MSRRQSVLTGVLGVVALAAAARLVYGPGAPSYDALFSLVWGRELIGLAIPDVQSSIAPTPHPGSMVLAGLVSPLGVDGARDALVAMGYPALGSAAVAIGFEARPLAGRAGAVLAGALVMLAPALAVPVREATVDIPYVALICWALALAMRDLAAVRGPLALIALAGLLRPEAWLFAGAFALWRGRRDPVAWGLVVAAPVLWVGMDLTLTGDPLYSSHSTHLIGRPTGLGDALGGLPSGARHRVGGLAALAAIVGAVAVLVFRPSAAPVAVGAPLVAAAAFIVLGVAGQPAIGRYTMLFAALLAPLAATAALGWTMLEPGEGVRRWWRPIGAILAVALAVVAVAGVHGNSADDQRRETSAGMQSLLEGPEVRQAIDGCRPLGFAATVQIPLARWVLDLPEDEVDIFDESTTSGVIVVSAEDRGWIFSDTETLRPYPRPPAGAQPIAEEAGWQAYAVGCGG